MGPHPGRLRCQAKKIDVTDANGGNPPIDGYRDPVKKTGPIYRWGNPGDTVHTRSKGEFLSRDYWH